MEVVMDGWGGRAAFWPGGERNEGCLSVWLYSYGTQ